MSKEQTPLAREIAALEQAVAAQEAQRAVLGDAVVETTMAALRAQLAERRGQLTLAAGPRSAAIAGAVPGQVATGDHAVQQQGRYNLQAHEMHVQIIEGRYDGPPPRTPDEARAIYRQVVAAGCRHLPLRGIDIGASDPTCARQPLRLAHVYVDLDTTALVPVEKDKRARRESPGPERETRPLGALEAAVTNRRLVLLGDPGGGKSTFVNYLAYSLAAGETGALPGWPKGETAAVPVHLILRDFARGLPTDLDHAAPRHLGDFLRARLEAHRVAFAGDVFHGLDRNGPKDAQQR